MWSVASTTASLASLYSDIGTGFVTVIAAVLTGLAALLVLGFGIRKVKKYITGRKA